MDKSTEQTFYDVHMHAMNLSHINSIAFIRRLNIEKKMKQFSEYPGWTLWTLVLVLFLALMAPVLSSFRPALPWVSFFEFAAVVVCLVVASVCLWPLRTLIAKWIVWLIVAIIVAAVSAGVVSSTSLVAAGLAVLLIGGAIWLRWWANSKASNLKRDADGKWKQLKNVLMVMERDMGEFFLLMEQDLKGPAGDIGKGEQLLKDGKLHVGGSDYSKMVLTPLLMDFNYKKIPDDPEIYYGKWPRNPKPIDEQEDDVFDGIAEYLDKSHDKTFEIYPFLGINTQSYDKAYIQGLLDKHFSDFKKVTRETLRAKMLELSSGAKTVNKGADRYYFAGIKLYPPLGFDPWPAEGTEEMEKVEVLYEHCEKNCVPITVHSSEGGFVVVSDEQMADYCAISKWQNVLKQHPDLKINLAHFPAKPGKGEGGRLEMIIDIVESNKNVYVDISYRAVNQRYYQELKKLVDKSAEKQGTKAKLEDRILFGTDFGVDLLEISSYNAFLKLFSEASFKEKSKRSRQPDSHKSDWDELKHKACCTNPEGFLFSRP